MIGRLLAWARQELRAPWLLWRVARIKRATAASLEKHAAIEAELEAELEAHARTRAALASIEQRHAALDVEVDAAIDRLYAEGRLIPGDPFEETLRAIASGLGMDAFQRAAARLPVGFRGEA